MQVLVALVALPFVALLLALASRLEDGLRARATARSNPEPLALTAGPSGGGPGDAMLPVRESRAPASPV
jgi:hypothetical protein